MFISFSNDNGSALENSLDSRRTSFRKRPCAMYKDKAVGNVVAETGRDLVFGSTAQLSDLSMPLSRLTGEVQRSPEPFARPSAAADSEERQICTTCLFKESVGLCLCFLASCAMYKDNAVANVVGEMTRDLVFMTTARLSDLSMPLKGEVRRSPEHSARQPIARSGKFARGAYSRRALDCEKTTVLCFLPSWSTLLSVLRGVGRRGEIYTLYFIHIIGSAEALPILCVSDFCERERERERERDACDVIDITLKSRVIMHMITSTARRPNASTRSECSNLHVNVKTRSLALERSIEQQYRVIDE